MKKINFSKAISFLFYILFFLLLLKNSYSYLDPDFGWHLKVGEEIYLTKKVPHINHYNYVFPEEENYWVNHEWLSDYLIFLVYTKFGHFGYLFLNIIFALIIVLTLYILNRFATKEIIKDKKSIYLIFILELLGLKAMFPHLGVRVQELSILFLLLLFLIVYYFEKKSTKKNKKSWLILLWIIPLFFLWANLHAGFLLGIFLLFLYLGIKILEIIIYKQKSEKIRNFFKLLINPEKILSTKNLFILGIISVISTGATILTPYKLSLFNFLHSYTNTAYLKRIIEWRPQYYPPFNLFQIIYIGIIIAIIIALIYKAKRKKEIIDLWTLCSLALFLLLSIKSKRNFPLLLIVAIPTITKYLFFEFQGVFKKVIKNKYLLLIKWKIIILLILLIVLLKILLWPSLTKNPFSSFCFDYPCQAVYFLKNNPKYLSYNIFNNYGWGGYLIYIYPEKKLFIDGRLPQKNIKNHSYIEEYGIFFNSEKETLLKKIEEYNIKMFLLDKPKKTENSWIENKIFCLPKELEQKNNRLITFLEENENWIKIYEDEISVIYVKK